MHNKQNTNELQAKEILSIAISVVERKTKTSGHKSTRKLNFFLKTKFGRLVGELTKGRDGFETLLKFLPVNWIAETLDACTSFMSKLLF